VHTYSWLRRMSRCSDWKTWARAECSLQRQGVDSCTQTEFSK